MTFNEFVGQVENTPPKRQRKGQQYFNMLTRVRPDITGKIEGTDLDPFEDDRIIPAFLTRVQELW